jgi:hypothetical protein
MASRLTTSSRQKSPSWFDRTGSAENPLPSDARNDLIKKMRIYQRAARFEAHYWILDHLRPGCPFILPQTAEGYLTVQEPGG